MVAFMSLSLSLPSTSTAALPPPSSAAAASTSTPYSRGRYVRQFSFRPPPTPLLLPSLTLSRSFITRCRRRAGVVRMAPEDEKMTRRSPLDFPIEWDRPRPGRRPDIIPQFSPMKTPLPTPMPADPPKEDDEEEEGEEKKEEEEEDPEQDDPDKQ